MNAKRISTKTPWGTLTAEIGGDPMYPEIFVFIEREDGVEHDLTCASFDKENNKLDAFLWGDTSTDDWTKKHTWSQEDINSKEENV